MSFSLTLVHGFLVALEQPQRLATRDSEVAMRLPPTFRYFPARRLCRRSNPFQPLRRRSHPSPISAMQSKLPHTRLANALTGLKLKAGSNTPKVALADGGLPASKSTTSRLRFLRPRQATVLSGIKITATIAGKVGAAAPVPVIQPIADGVKQIVDYCEVCALCLKKRGQIQPMVFTS